MNQFTESKHSRLGLFSCFVAIGIWVYLAVLTGLFFFTDWFPKFFGDQMLPASRGISDLRGLGMAIVWLAALFLFVPVIGHIAGFVCGAAGALSRRRNRLFAFTGLFLNLLPFIVGLFFYLVGYFAA
ncbi:MAG: hypothetical protein JSS81_01445 [Acidobacteria bacterium]|nr:hypothetical protein [Acidobacteriota bacterium]